MKERKKSVKLTIEFFEELFREVAPMLKKIVVAISAGVILAALLIPALAGQSVSIDNVAVEKVDAIAITDITPAPVRTN